MEPENGEIVEVIEIHDDLGIYGPLGHSYTVRMTVDGRDLGITVH